MNPTLREVLLALPAAVLLLVGMWAAMALLFAVGS